MKIIKRFPQVILGLALGYAGIGHLTTSRQEFQAQVPTVFADIADFVVVHLDGSRTVEDVKAFDKKKKKFLTTPLFNLKKKLIESQYKIKIILV